jgi:TolB-like protein/DNA-binding winged helix-turn-helix (wHTH) protein/Flp pilus assembly protein TadD
VAALSRPPLRFGVFEADLEAGELRKHGLRIKLPHQSFRVLQVLLGRPMQVISRDELRQSLWPADTFVEFDHNLNTAVSRLREALGDVADSPRFVETLPRRGYRFIAPVETPEAAPAGPAPDELPPAAVPVTTTPVARTWLALSAVAVAVTALGAWYAVDPGPAPSSAPTTVAVLPFEAGDDSDGSTDRYVAFGMTEALITELSRVGALRVISQTSVMQYQGGARKPLKQIANELGAGTIVEGSVLREGDRVRITVQLIDAGTDTHLWAQSYGRRTASALEDQRELAREVAGIIRSRLAPSDRTTAPSIEQTNAVAYEAYVKGRYFIQQATEESWVKGRVFFEQSIAADPGFAPAHVGLSTYYGVTDSIPPAEAIPKARASALRALALDDTLAAAHAALGYVHYFGDWNWVETERRLARAIELDPNDAWSRRWLALYMSAVGRSATAIEEIERAMKLDPVSVSPYDAAAAIYFDARRFDKIIEMAQRIDELSPNDPRALAHLATAYFHQRKWDQAIDAATKGLDLAGRSPLFLCLLAVAQHGAGLRESAEQTLMEVMQLAGKGYVPDVMLALTHLWMRGPEAAQPFLQRAFERRDGYLVIMKSTPWFDPMRGHAGYEAVVRRMNFPP